MRPINNFALHACAAAVLTAFAATGAAAQLLGDSTPGATDAARDGQTLYLALGDSIPGATGAIKNDGRGGGWIEIQGWDWGETRAGKATFKEFTITKKTDTASAPSGDPDRPLIAGRVPNPGAEQAMNESGQVDALTDGLIIMRNSAAPPPAPLGTQQKITVGGGRTESGQATGKRQHMPIRMRTYADQSPAPAEKRQHGWVTVSKPLDRGSVRVKVRFPWLDCRVGATFPDATLDDAAGRNSFSEVTVTRCDNDAVTLSYAKVTVRGWDPAKKEE